MSKKLLTERSDSLTYIKESFKSDDGKNRLGKLAGIGADFTKATRNGRRYPLQLWRNVENSDDFKEGMNTLTIFGENDHPEDRVDTSIKEISIVLTKFEIRENEGTVYTEFDILDTPQGRILKSLLDYGSKIGVSSRGLGEEIVKDGETIIDPDTYVFYAFDAVVMPAVKSARPSVMESLTTSDSRLSALAESLNREVENAKSISELQSIKEIADIIKSPTMDSLKESIDIKLNTGFDGDNISAKLQEEIGELAQKNEDLIRQLEESESKLSANNIRINKMKNLLHETIRNSNKLSKLLQRSKISVCELQDSIIEGTDQISELSDLREKDKREYDRNIRRLNRQLSNAKSENESLKESIESYKNKLSENNSYMEKLKSDINRKNITIKNLNENIKKSLSNKELLEKKSSNELSNLKSRLERMSSQIDNVTKKYLHTKCAQENISVDTVLGLLPKTYTITDIDKIVSELSDRKRRLDKVPIVLQPRVAMVSESVSKISDEDKQTMAILNGSIN